MSNVFELPMFKIVDTEGKSVVREILITKEWSFSLSGIPMPIVSVCNDIPTEGMKVEEIYQFLKDKYSSLKNTRVNLIIDFNKKNIHIEKQSESLVDAPMTEMNPEIEEKSSPGTTLENSFIKDGEVQEEEDNQEIVEMNEDPSGQISLFNDDAIIAPKSGGQVKLDLFGPEPDADCSESCETSNSKVKRPAPRPKTQVKEIKIDSSEWKIAYAAQTFPVIEFFEGSIPNGGVTTEQIRQKLEQDFPEFSKVRTFWEYDEERKILFPIIRGTSKGA